MFKELTGLLAPLVTVATEGEEGLYEMLEEAGLSHLAGEELGTASLGLLASLEALAPRLDALAAIDPATAGSAELTQALGVLAQAFQVSDSVGDVAAAVAATLAGLEPDEDLPTDPAQIALALRDWLLWRWISSKGALGPALQLVGVLTPPDDERGARLNFAALSDVLTDPQAALARGIGWGGPKLNEDPLFGLMTRGAACADRTTRLVSLPDGRAGICLPLLESEENGAVVEAGLCLSVEDGAQEGHIQLAPYGAAAFQGGGSLGGDLKLTVAGGIAGEDLPALTFAPSGIGVDGGSPPDAQITAKLTREAEDGTPIQLIPFGAVGGISAKSLDAELKAVLSPKPDIALGAGLEGGALEVDPSRGDGFLATLLKGISIRAPFDLDVAVDRTGVSVQGSGGLEIDIPVNDGISEVLRVETVHLTLAAPGAVPTLTVALTGSGKLGPFAVSLERVGAQIAFTPKEATGGALGVRLEGTKLKIDLGAAELEARLKLMSGVGISVDLGAVSGGGALSVDAEAGRYAGALALKAEAIGLSAFGVVLTKLPDGGDGFSLLAFLRGSFAPIPVGFGFTLNAVGGIVGLHRDLDATALFEAVRAGRAGELLDPEDPVRDATRLISQAEAIFPSMRGRHVFGPTVQIGWGIPRTLISLDLALALNLPAPLRVALIGKVKAALPKPDLPLIALNVDVAGVLDLGLSTLEIEGRLFDSRITTTTITGGFALQMAWGRRRAFAFSVGGLHPGFVLPVGFPELPRAGASLIKTPVLSLQLEAYTAITSNSLQFGAAVDLKAKAGDFRLEAGLAFDALILLDPFQLDARLRASARILRGRETLMRLALDARLRGPGPWQINGKVSFEILWVEVDVSIARIIGAAVPRESDPVDVAARLRTALARAQNWAGVEEAEGTVRLALSEGVVDPGRGVAFSQQELPLGFALQRFAGLPITGARWFDLTGLRLAGRDLRLGQAPEEPFASGAFLNLSDAEKLTAPAFLDERSGLKADPRETSAESPPALRTGTRRVVRIERNSLGAPETRGQDTWIAPDVTERAAPPRSAPRVRVWPERWRPGASGEGGPITGYGAARDAAGRRPVRRASEG